MRLPKKINLYIAKSFFIGFLQISLAFSLLIFFINFLEALDKSNSSSVPLMMIFFMAFLKIPDFLNDIAPTLVLFSAIFTFFSLSLKSEVNVMRSSGLSLWSIVMPVGVAAFLLGIFWIAVFSPLTIKMTRQFDYLEGRYIKNELRETFAPENGIWIKQVNMENPKEEIIIQAKKVYKQGLEFDNASIWYFGEDGKFYKKIDAVQMFLKQEGWVLNKVSVNDDKLLNKHFDNIIIPTNLDPNFVIDKIVTNFQNVKLFSLLSLPKMIKSLEMAGFQSTKFKVYMHSLLAKPFLFFSMTLIACFFGINHVRNQQSTIMLFCGIVCGLAMYVSLSFIAALGSSKIIPVFASTYLVTMICIAIGVLLIYKKEAI